MSDHPFDVLAARALRVGAYLVRADDQGRLYDGIGLKPEHWRRAQTLLADAPEPWQKLLTSDPGDDRIILPNGGHILRLSSNRRGRHEHTILAVIEPCVCSKPLGQVLSESTEADSGCTNVTTPGQCNGCAAACLSDPITVECLLRCWYEDLFKLGRQESELTKLSQQLAETYEELNLLYRLGQELTVSGDPRCFVQSLCQDLLEVMSFRWVAVKLFDLPELSEQLAGMFVCEGTTQKTINEAEQAVEALAQMPQVHKPAVVLDIASQWGHLLPALGNSLLAYPLYKGETMYGLIVAIDKDPEAGDISSVDLKLVGSTASQLRIFLDNVTLYDQMHLMFLGTLEALTAAVDAKDRYTCGHSQRVALLSRQLAEALGLPPDRVERIHIAGLMHDVGKIGVPESVLCKAGKLTKEEYEIIKGHPEIGANIVKDIPHFDDIIPGVLYHHERYDGKGYPHGLAGEDIPMMGRLLALADSFDAMSSTRTYRAALPRERVLEEIQACAGSQFDPDLTPHFLSLDFSEYDGQVANHKAGDPGAQGVAA
ncbi:MAG: HD-GYP domain-containing protein [Planctomycetes bacterium]|nr:HD-GYP domain-containing protein [Planctomycetota bacterium]NOG54104.1 HD-GYP domain-containing protein [Planctomycetota bacterium]